MQYLILYIYRHIHTILYISTYTYMFKYTHIYTLMSKEMKNWDNICNMPISQKGNFLNIYKKSSHKSREKNEQPNRQVVRHINRIFTTALVIKI